MIGSLGLAAGQFALQCAGRRWLDRLKRRRLASAYRDSAEETINLCVQEGYEARSAVWNRVTDLLGSEVRARQIARWYTQGISPDELQDMDNGDPTVGHFLRDFIVRLNDRRADLLPVDLANLADIISERMVLLIQQAQSSAPEPPSSTAYWLGLPPSLDEMFVGRESELATLAGDLENRQIVIISGGPGTGKSRLAAEYASRADVGGFWTTAGVNAMQTLIALADCVGVPVEGVSDEDIAREVQRRLSELPQETIWVIDNVQDLDMVTELSSAVSSIHLLATTRDARSNLLSPAAAFREIQVLDADPAIALLCSRRRPESTWDPQDKSLEEIAELVGRLPLALEFIAVRLGVPRQTPDRILGELKTTATPIELQAFQEVAGATIPRVEGLYATLVGTLATLPINVREQLSALGYVADLPIPDLLLAVLTGLEGRELEGFIEECCRHSIFSLVDAQVIVHALTIAAIAATNGTGMLSTNIIRVDERIVSTSVNDPSVFRLEIAHYERILKQFKKALGTKSAITLSLATSLGAGYAALGRYDEAAQLHEETLHIREEMLGSEDPNTLMSRHNLANCFQFMGKNEAALRLATETMSDRQRVLGPDHPHTLTTRTIVGNCYRQLGRFEDALRLDEETLKMTVQVLGLQHPDALGSRQNLASDYRALERYGEAVRLDEGTLLFLEHLLGPEHPQTLGIRNNLANSYFAFGRYEDVLRLHEENLRIREQIFGPEHPDTLESRNNLANAYISLDRFQDAVQVHQETLHIRERLLGDRHPDTLSSRNNLASAYLSQGRYEDGVRLFEETLRARELVLGPEHPDTEVSRNNLATSYRASGRVRE